MTVAKAFRKLLGVTLAMHDLDSWIGQECGLPKLLREFVEADLVERTRSIDDVLGDEVDALDDMGRQ